MRFASDIAPFAPARRALYKAVKISDGKAEYYFEPVYLADPTTPTATACRPGSTPDEFVADMWTKGIRFGIDIAAVRAAIASGKAERVDRGAPAAIAVPGIDAHIIEVSRRPAPQRRAAPAGQRQAGPDGVPEPLPADPARRRACSRKCRASAGVNGFDLSGTLLEPAIPKDVDLRAMAGPGTDGREHRARASSWWRCRPAS